MVTYRFVIRKERNNAVMLRFTANRKSSELGLGISLSPGQLDEILSGITPKDCKNQSRLVKYYQNVLLELQESLSDKETKTITAAEFQKRVRYKADLNRNFQGARGKGDVLPVFEEKIESMRNLNSKGTYELSLKYVKGFCLDGSNSFYKDPELLNFEDITSKWLTAFDAWMEKKGLSINSRWLHLTKLHVVANKAIDDEIIDRDPFRRFKIKKEKTRKRSLSVEDLRRFFNCPATKFQQFHIDMFKLIFMLIGINAEDLFNLKSISRQGRIEYRRAKTGSLYSIKVEPEALEIIEKYKGEKNLLMLADRFNSSRIYTIYTNKELKKIGKRIDSALVANGEKSELEESELSQISTYWARHTWATIARRLKIPKDDIALALGHRSGHDMTDIYIEEDMELVDIANRRVLDYVLYDMK